MGRERLLAEMKVCEEGKARKGRTGIQNWLASVGQQEIMWHKRLRVAYVDGSLEWRNENEPFSTE